MKQFKVYEENPSSVPELYLETLNLQLEMPDMSRLEKPAKPPVPQVCNHNYTVSKCLIFNSWKSGVPFKTVQSKLALRKCMLNIYLKK